MKKIFLLMSLWLLFFLHWCNESANSPNNNNIISTGLFFNDFENIYENRDSGERIVSKTERIIEKIWNNSYQYSFSENDNPDFISVSFAISWDIKKDDIQLWDNERWEAWIFIKEIEMYWLHDWINFQKKDKNWRSVYTILRCQKSLKNTPIIKSWTGVVTINKDKIYHYHNHITGWSQIDLSKFINHITTYMWKNTSDCLVNIRKLSEFDMHNLPFSIDKNLDWEIAIITDKGWNFWCASSVWKWNIELLILFNNDTLCGIEERWVSYITNIWIKR